MIKLDNHRQLGVNEIIRKGDFYKENGSGKVTPVKHSIGRVPKGYTYGYTFWRRLHTKKVIVVVPRRQPTVAIKSQAAKYPTVRFEYNFKHREVQVIALNDKYLTGLEVTRYLDDKTSPKYQFKKFLRTRLQTQPVLVKMPTS